jgi:hypothetical protein
MIPAICFDRLVGHCTASLPSRQPAITLSRRARSACRLCYMPYKRSCSTVVPILVTVSRPRYWLQQIQSHVAALHAMQVRTCSLLCQISCRRKHMGLPRFCTIPHDLIHNTNLRHT